MSLSRYTLGAFLISCFIVTGPIIGCGPKLGHDFTKLDNVPSGKAVVYIYRPFGNLGYLIPIDIYSNQKPIVSMPHQSYYPYLVNPGEAEFSSRHGVSKELHESITINAKAGEVYYVKTTMRPVGKGARISLEVMPLEEGGEEIKECKLILETSNSTDKKP